MSQRVEYLFVYGTLMKGFYNNLKGLDKETVSNVPACIRGTLYHMKEKGYPALVEGDGLVYGELLSVKSMEKALAITDCVECVVPGAPPDEYDRQVREVKRLDTGETVRAYVYCYVKADLGAKENPAVLLPRGNWRAYMERRETEKSQMVLAISKMCRICEQRAKKRLLRRLMPKRYLQRSCCKPIFKKRK